MSLVILFHFLCAQHVSDINISIIRSLRLCCWITTWVVLFSVRCVLEIWCGWVWVMSVLQAVGDFVRLSLSGVRVAGCWRFGAAGFEWCPCCRLLEIWFGRVWVVSVLQAVGDLVRLGLSSVRVAGWKELYFTLQHRHHSNPTAPNLQHTTNREQNDRCCNSTAKSLAPDDGYINVRNMLSA